MAQFKIFVSIALFAILLVSCDKAKKIDPIKSLGYEKYFKNVDDENIEKSIRLKSLDSALQKALSMKKDTIKRHILFEIANKYDNIGELKSYFEVNQEVLQLSNSIDDSIGIGTSIYKIASYYARTDQLDSAYAKYYWSGKIFNELKEDTLAGKAILGMAITQKNRKDYIGSEESSIKAIKKFENTDKLRYLASSYNNLGTVSRRLGKYDDAIGYYETAQEYRKKLSDNMEVTTSTLNNIGAVYIDKKEYDKAITYFKEALAFDNLESKRPKTYGRLLDNLAYASYKSGDEESFPEMFLKPLYFRDSINDRLGYVTSNKHLAEIYKEKGNRLLALSYARAAYQKAKEITYNDGILESLELLMTLETPEKGVEYGEEYITLNTELYKQEKAFQDQSARIRFETDRLEIEKDKATETARRLIIIFSFVAILFLLGYIVLQRRNNRKELEYQEGQQQANEEIFNLMLSQQTKLEEGKHLAKQRISEELHDGILSRLFGLRLSLDSLNTKHGKEVENLRSTYIDQLKDLGKEIRRISHDINDEAFSPDSLYPDVLQKLLNEQLETQDVIYQFVYDQDINWDIISNPKKVHIYRIIQECVMNINKHAKAEHITVTFKRLESDIQLIIEDDGVGMDTSKAKSGIGMKNIKSRVAQIAGSYKVISKINLGTQIQILFN